MNAWLVQVKREFWEHQTLFWIIPLTIAAVIIIAGSYVVAVYSSVDSRVGNALFGNVYFIGTDHNSGSTVHTRNEGLTTSEYIIDFTKSELVRSKDFSTGDSTDAQRHHALNKALYSFHTFIMLITGIVLMFYQINCLYADRRDRSILFWKSMPVSETRNVATKLIVSLLAVPLLATVISWGIQLCYLVLSSIFVYRVGSNPWEVVWGRLDLLHVFSQELLLFLWSVAWWLPLAAWLMFASALGKRSPFLLATVPVVVLIIMEKLFFGSWYIGGLLSTHFKTVLFQMSKLIGDDLSGDTINIFLDNPAMLAGFLIAGFLFSTTVWLRNHRFEI